MLKALFPVNAALLLTASVLVLGGCKPANSTETAALEPVEPVAAATNTAATAAASPTVSKAAVTTPRPAPAPAAICVTCGTVQSITPVTVKGEGSGLGAAIGAVVGGLAGNQVGGGTGKKLATVAGVVGGAYAGNAIERNRRGETYYDITVAMENGSYRTLSVGDPAGIAVGSAVTVDGDVIRLR